MITRKEYMENPSDLHDAYYGQFVTETVKNLVRGMLKSNELSIEFVSKEYKYDKWMNFIGIKIWDNLFYFVPKSVFVQIRESGDVNAHSPANSVCVLKAAARMLVNEYEFGNMLLNSHS